MYILQEKITKNKIAAAFKTGKEIAVQGSSQGRLHTKVMRKRKARNSQRCNPVL